MSAINDLISQIENPELRQRIQQEVAKMSKQKKFGLVFEEHLPENTPLYELPIRSGIRVAKRDGDIRDNYQVLSINDGIAECIHLDDDHEKASLPVEDLIAVAQFGEPIYPYLKPIDSICNAPDSELWHTLIQADNYHALQLLVYLYGGKVDCIYIDPPYNTGARDWKYNNDYVDSNDAYRHSKWLSMMQKRLKLAKKLLNPLDSVLIVTIDEKEYLHLGCLLEELFPESNMQMVTDIIKTEGTSRLNEFSRTNEYIFFVMIGSATVPSGKSMFETSQENGGNDSLKWRGLRRRESHNTRAKNPNEFYPIFVEKKTGNVHSIGDALPLEMDRHDISVPEGCFPVFPLMPDGKEGMWGKIAVEARKLLEKGYLYASKYDPKNGTAQIVYLQSGSIQDIVDGKVTIEGFGEHHQIIGHYNTEKTTTPKSVWYQKSHNSQVHGSLLIKSILGGNRFTYPKSLYSEKDAIAFFIANKPNAIIVDFFAGSGTTLHAVNLLNAEDGGHRRCILVTNNEVSDAEAKEMTAKGLKPGDEEWEKLGIARYVTWPRTVCSIEGHDVNGNPLKGNYLGSDLPMSDGFKANAAFFKLGFLDKTKVSLGMQFKEMLPTLWMKAGAKGECPKIETEDLPDMLICDKNHFAVLINEKKFAQFVEKVSNNDSINMVYLVVDSDSLYRIMAKSFPKKETCQLYRDYLDNFRINITR